MPNFTWKQRSQIFIVYTCAGSDIHLMHTDRMTRQEFAVWHVILDAVQMAVCMAFLLWMRAKVIKEVNQVEESLMEAQDFSVRITNMPQLKNF